MNKRMNEWVSVLRKYGLRIAWYNYCTAMRRLYSVLRRRVGMVKINFSGGEPFLPLRGNYVGELVKFCKDQLKLPSVTIVSNGSLIKEDWFAKYGVWLNRGRVGKIGDFQPISCCISETVRNRAKVERWLIGSRISPSRRHENHGMTLKGHYALCQSRIFRGSPRKFERR